MKVIRRLDNYNFTLATKLSEPKIVKIKDKEIVYTYKNEDKFFGNLYGAIRGFIIYNGLDKDIKVPESYKKIKPTSDEELYSMFLESRDALEMIK